MGNFSSPRVPIAEKIDAMRHRAHAPPVPRRPEPLPPDEHPLAGLSNNALARVLARAPKPDPQRTKVKKIENLYKTIGAVSTSRTAVLIEGESGTGKELVAKAIHYSSADREKPCRVRLRFDPDQIRSRRRTPAVSGCRRSPNRRTA